MKVAVSVPDKLGQAVDRAARRLRIPRSQFYARALEAFLRDEEKAGITERLNEVYSRVEQSRDPFLEAAAAGVPERDPS